MQVQQKNINILHISDIHFNMNSEKRIKNTIDKLVLDTKEIMKKTGNIDFVCITGDIIQRGDLAEQLLDRFLETVIINKLIVELGVREEQILIVPGNHEVNQKEIEEYQEEGLKGRLISKKEIDSFIAKNSTEPIKRIIYFNEFVQGVNPKVKYINNFTYTNTSEIDEIKIGFVGLNSAWRSTGSGGKERGSMVIGDAQIADGLKEIKNTDIKICLMHHPTDWLVEEDKKYVDMQLNNFDIVLNGHVHENFSKQIQMYSNKTLYLTAGKIHPLESIYNGYNIISINPYSKEAKVSFREFYVGRDEFDLSLRVNKDGEASYQLNGQDETQTIAYNILVSVADEIIKQIDESLVCNILEGKEKKKFEECFIEPAFRSKSEYRKEELLSSNIEGTGSEDKDKNKNVELEELLGAKENMVFIGRREIGKTSLIYKFINSYIKEYRRYNKIPIYIDCSRIRSGQKPILVAATSYILEKMDGTKGLRKQDIETIIRSGNALILFDDLDTSNSIQSKSIKEFIENYPENRYIFTTNENIFTTLEAQDLPDLGCNYKSFYITNMTTNQIRRFTDNWFETSHNSEQVLDNVVRYFDNIAMPRTPFNLSLLLTICDIEKNFVPVNESNVISRFMEILLEKLSPGEVFLNKYDFEDKERFLSYLAEEMFLSKQYYFEENEFIQLTLNYHKKKGYSIGDTKFDKIFLEKQILIKNEKCIFFKYASMLEYYIAKSALQNEDIRMQMISENNYLQHTNEICYLTSLNRESKEIITSIESYMDKFFDEKIEYVESLDNYDITTELGIDKERVKKSKIPREERDRIRDTQIKEKEYNPIKLKKDTTINESNNFLETLLLYGRIIRNSSDLDLAEKIPHVKKYMNSYFIVLASINLSVDKIKQREKILKEDENQNKEFSKEEKEIIMLSSDLIKISAPLVFQNIIAENIGTAKLAQTISFIVKEGLDNEFIEFMYIFLFVDLRVSDSFEYMKDYIKSLENRDLMKLCLMKLMYYYATDYYENKNEELTNIISDISLKLNNTNKFSKSKYTQRLKENKKLISRRNNK